MEKLTVSKIANILGLEESIIQNILSRDDEELSPYVKRKKEDEQDADYVLDLEGLPLLIKKLSINITTSEIIENLACQVLHLTALEENNTYLEEKIERLDKEVDEFRKKVMELQNIIEKEKAKSLKNRISRIFGYGD